MRNKDSRILSEAYSTILNEMMPVYSSDFGPAALAPKIHSHKPTAAPGKTPEPSGYQIGKTAQSRGVDVAKLTEEILDRIKNNLFTPQKGMVSGKAYDLSYPGEPDQFKDEVAKIIADVCKLPTVTTACKHAARIIMNDVLDVVALRTGGTVKASSVKLAPHAPLSPPRSAASTGGYTPPPYRPATPRVATPPPTPEFNPEVLDAVAHAVESQPRPSEHPSPEAPREPSEISRAKDFKLHGEYEVSDDMPDAAYNRITSADRRANAKVARERLVKSVGKGFKRKGAELVNAIKMPSYQEAKIALRDLLNIGGLTDAEDESSKDVALIAPPEEDAKAVADKVAAELEREQMGGKTAPRGSYE